MTLKEILNESPYPEIGIVYEDLPSEQDPVNTCHCGKLVAIDNELQVYEAGIICPDCFHTDPELIKCNWCSLIMTKSDLVKYRTCPACGCAFEEE